MKMLVTFVPPDSSSKRIDMRCLVDVIFVDHYWIEFSAGHTSTVIAL